MTGTLERPIRIVYFAGPYLEPSAKLFVTMLDEHPDLEFVLGLCEAEGTGWRQRLRNLWRRRGLVAIPVYGLEAATAAWRWLRHPRRMLDLRRRSARALSRFVTVPDIHDPQVLAKVRDARPDLGVIYGAPILRPELFSIPRLGTLGIHHGRAPQYRGKKTTFWEMYHGERCAGVTIQRVSAGLDTGDIVRSGEVEIGSKGYGRVWREVEDLGRHLYLEAILEVGRGQAKFVPQDPAATRAPLFRQPAPGDILRFWLRRWTGGGQGGAT